MGFIDNKNKTMREALANALQTADEIDICVGYFYFSGFQLLADQLREKKIRILVGKELDPQCIPEIVNYSRTQEVSLDKYGMRKQTESHLQLRQNYIDALVGFVNDSDTFDSEESTSVFEMFVSKIFDGSLEIRKTLDDYHGKFYVVKNRTEHSQGGDFPGTVFHGSSNFTYRGLAGQDELNDVSREIEKYESAIGIFEELWNSSRSISIVDSRSAEEFVGQLKQKLWIYQAPSPYVMYLRVLEEIYGESQREANFKTPSAITAGTFMDFEYQTDAVAMAIDRIEKLDGVIIADVVGLGKSIIAAAIAYNLDYDTLIICPPHLIPQWQDYKVEFRVRGPRVFSSGNIKLAYEAYSDSRKPLLIIIDEAHRFRNEDTNDYKMLHQICRSHPDNKVVLLTATPFNNSPKDVFALMKLFQTPGQSTIRSIDNLSLRFRELIRRYGQLRRSLRHISEDDFEREIAEIAEEQRRYLEPVVIRRSRLDLEFVTRYRLDLERQGIRFPRVVGPELVDYDLGDLVALYLETLEQISDPDDILSFKGARYKPATYIRERDKFLSRYGKEIDDSDLTAAQTNLADFMRKLLVMRFESSRAAFRITLERMIANNHLILNWWHELETVPIMKKGSLPDPGDFSLEDGEMSDELEARLEHLRTSKGLIEVPTEWVDESFVADVESDTRLLEEIHRWWFGEIELPDPKIERIRQLVNELLTEEPDRKIVIFSSYADTVNYVASKLSDGLSFEVLSYTAGDSSKANREELLRNFDASLSPAKQEDKYSILVCTDALSEGVNLNRAGIIINYDIPYNPTRVIQRIGRINRINKLVFPEIRIYNCFPTYVGERETQIRAISTLKIGLINNVIGSDSKTLTPDEDVQTFFRDAFQSTEGASEELSWDAQHLQAYEEARSSGALLEEAAQIPRRTRISRLTRNGQSGPSAIVFTKKGSTTLFISAHVNQPAELVSIQEGLSRFRALPDEESSEPTSAFPEMFEKAWTKLGERHPLPEIRGRRGDAIKVIEAIGFGLTAAEAYCSDLIRIISKFDDVSDGTLKDIARIEGMSLEESFEELRRLVPEAFIRNVMGRIERMEDSPDLIVLVEEFH